MDNLYNYSIKNICLKNKDIKKLIIHNIIHAMCEEVLSNINNEKVVIFLSTNSLPYSSLNDFIPEEEMISFIEKNIVKMKKFLPLNIYITSFSFEYFNFLIKKNKAEGTDMLFNMLLLLENSNFDKFTFQKLRNYSKKYGLTFLSNIYFNNIKSKQLLMK